MSNTFLIPQHNMVHIINRFKGNLYFLNVNFIFTEIKKLISNK